MNINKHLKRLDLIDRIKSEIQEEVFDRYILLHQSNKERGYGSPERVKGVGDFVDIGVSYHGGNTAIYRIHKKFFELPEKEACDLWKKKVETRGTRSGGPDWVTSPPEY